jgi:hypothetical protein
MIYIVQLKFTNMPAELTRKAKSWTAVYVNISTTL